MWRWSGTWEISECEKIAVSAAFKAPRFPTLDDFDFLTRSSLNKSLVTELSRGDVPQTDWPRSTNQLIDRGVVRAYY